ncbi:MAG: SH3 domain-containing protein [Anaerolineae bacterium]
MPRLHVTFYVLFTLLLCAAPIFAQDQCSDLVQNAITAAEQVCDGVARNQVCYGNINLQADGQPDAPAIRFDEPGDIENIGYIRTLRLDGMNVDASVWGIALMRLQANLPDTDPAKNVTVVMFGDVNIDNDVPVLVTLPAAIDAPGSANVRQLPSTQATVIVSLTDGTPLTATGHSSDGQWIRVRLDGEQSGWVLGQLLAVEGDVNTLESVAPGSTAPQYGPMQAFILNTGTADAQCSSAPSSGILIQTPEGVGEISLLINEVDIRLGSTAYITAGRDASGANSLAIHMVEGTARVEANGVAQYLRAGQQLTVPLSADFRANGQPSDPHPYDAREAALPLTLVEREIQPAEPYVPDPSAPVITRVDVTHLSTTRTREDITFTDVEGDVSVLDISIADISDNGINYIFRGTAVNIGTEQQQAGAVFSRETICTEGTDGVEALFRIVLTDAAGLGSNVVEYRTRCGQD